MNLGDVARIRVPRTARKRVGRGWGSGMGKTSTRGEKGAGRRSGTRFRLRFEGGQMPLYRRLPKKGFRNARFRVTYVVVNVGQLDAAFEAGATVDLASLSAAHLVPKNAARLKILGDGEVTKALRVSADAASAGARKKIEAAGGTLAVPEREPEPAPKPRAPAKAAAKAEGAAVASGAKPEKEKKEKAPKADGGEKPKKARKPERAEEEGGGA
jgi:large subunit ribosomal protein L15